MKRILLIIMVLVGLTAQAQQTFNPTIRLLNVAENPSAEMVLVVNEVTKNIEWVKRSEISPDLSGYYTSSEVDLLLEDYYTSSETDALFLGYYTSAEVDAIIADYYTKTEANARFATKTELNTKENAFSKNTAFNKNFGTGSNDVARGNHTHTFASLTSKPTTIGGYGITDFNSLGDARWALRTRSITGTGSLTGGGNLTANRTIDLSSTTKSDIAKGVEAYNLSNKAILTEMVSGNTSTIEAPDLNNIPNGSYTIGLSVESINSPFSVPRSLIRFGGNVESLLTDIVASPNSIAFRNVGNNAWRELWHSGNLSDPATETWSDGRFALRTRTITGTGSLTGGGDLTANRTIDLTNTAKSDIAKGVTAHGWGDYRDWGLGSIGVSDSEIDNINGNLFFRTGSSNVFGNYGSGISLNRQFSDGGRIAQLHIATPPSGSEVSLKSRIKTGDGWSNVVELWHTGNLENPATESWVNSQGFIKSISNYYTKTEANDRFVRTTGVQDIADTKTFLDSPVVPNPTLDEHAVNKEYVDNRATRVDFNYSYTGSANANTNLDDFTVVVNDLDGFSINAGGDISLGEGVYLLSLYVSNNSYPLGSGYTSISSNIGGSSSVTMNEYIKYGGSFSKIIVIPTNINNGRIHLTKQNMENLQGVATLSIVKIK